MDFAIPKDIVDKLAELDDFIEREIKPLEAENMKFFDHRRENSRTDWDNDGLPTQEWEELLAEMKRRADAAGHLRFALPKEIGGQGGSNLAMAIIREHLAAKGLGLHNELQSEASIVGNFPIVHMVHEFGSAAQRQELLEAMITGAHRVGFGLTEPNHGSDATYLETTASRDGGDWVINGTKHFISQADWADYVILFAATGEEEGPRGPRKKITSFIVDKGAPGFEVRPGYNSVSHRGYHNFVLNFDDCRLHESQVLGDVDHGFDVANQWLAATRLSVAACSLGQARRAHEMAVDWSATRKQFGQTIGRFQGVSFKLADMALQIKAAELLTLEAAWKLDRGTMTDSDAAMAKLHATETLAMVTDEAIQIHGGMGLMDELPLERFWRDARVERIWEGTSEIQRHIISRALLRPLES